jgi:hypothetical protein
MKLAEIYDALDRWKGLGFRRLSSGSVFYGDPIHNSGLGWLHRVYAPILKPDLTTFKLANPYFEKFSYADELVKYNGFNLFYGAYFMFGLRIGKSESSLDLPFNIVTKNRENWGGLAGPDRLIIGGANFGYRSVSYIESEDHSVSAVENRDAVVHKWSNLNDFMQSEIRRLSRVFDDSGRPRADLEKTGYLDV